MLRRLLRRSCLKNPTALTDPVASAGRARSERRAGAGATVRRIGVLLLAVAAAVLISMPGGQTDLEWKLAEVARDHSFNLWTWEAGILASREKEAILQPASDDRIDTVRSYFQAAHAAADARSRRDDLWARQTVSESSTDLTAAQSDVEGTETALSKLRPIVEATLSAEIEAELQHQGIRSTFLSWNRVGGFPFFQPKIVPGVFFQLGILPDLLLVAPTDKIEIVGNVLIDPNLPPADIDALERGADNLGYSSIVTGIGGLAAYPSMVPDLQSPRDLLNTVAHEWTHHYLAFQPLGQAYFDSYLMREINETVADMVGHELGASVYDQLYRPSEAPLPARPATIAPTATPVQNYGTLMRGIRTMTEGYFARHDVAGANAYLADQQKELLKLGYYVRRLNTAYLSFFGSYSGGANPVEPKLRQIRARSTTLATFLTTVEQIRTPGDLDRLATG